MARLQIVGLLLGLCAAAGCGSTSKDDAEAETDSTTTASGTQAVSTTATASVTATTSSSATTAGGNGNGNGGAGSGGAGSGGAGTDGTSTAAAETTGAGGGAGNANATSETSTTAAGGSGGEAGTCPNDPPNPDSSCAGVGELCAYEDCAGVGRTVASCVSGAWSVTTSACGETVTCSAGGEQCSEGEICFIRAGGAFLQDCVPNTCETGPVECNCIEGCYWEGDCVTYGSAETGITITCNTCPNGMLCP